jgi:RND family efflux transporter MFP subunit
MKKLVLLFGLFIVIFATACGTTSSGTPLDGVPTPTPLPTPVVPEKPQYTVEQGTVVNALTFNGRISPVNEAQLAFETSGSVGVVNVSEGDNVEAGAILAELNVAEQEKAIRDAEQALTEAQRSLETAEREHAEKLLEAEINLQKSILSRSGSNDNGQNLLNLQKEVETAQSGVDAAAQEYQEAVADPNSEQAYVDGLAKQLESAEQSLLVAQDNLEKGQRGSGSGNTTAELSRIQEERNYLKLLQGVGPELQWAVEKAELALEEARGNLQKAQLVAPFNGRILSVSIRRGTSAEPFKPVIVMAQLDALEVTANLNAKEMEKLSAGQVAQIHLLNRPEEALTGEVRTLPYPYSGGSGDANNQEKVVRISINTDTELTLGELAEVTITLQEKENVLWLPPAAIRKFQGRNFVVVQHEGGQQRVDVRLGIESEDRVEILEGVEAGQVILGE